MKKFLKKSKYLLIILILLVVNFSMPTKEVAEAKTLRDLKAELNAAKKKYEESQDDKKLTEEQISKKNEEINAISREIEDIREEIQNLNLEIETLEKEIVEKGEEIKKIINYYQLSSSESAYLEYIFEAADFTYFIYRMAVSEQLSSYNDKLIDEYNKTIKENEQKKKDLDAKTISLGEKQITLQKDLNSLGSRLSDITDISISAEKEIESLEELVNTYENELKCDLDEDINNCGNGQLPPGTAFYRPVVSGYISSDFGPRTYYLKGKKVSDFHYGVDFGGAGHGAPVYAAANGKVVFITRKSNCGGNMVYIQHTVNGQKYTTGYFHLAKINVNLNDIVTTNTVIGAVGGDPNIETWDGCSTGSHLHFQVATGHIPYQVGFYTAFTANYINPRTVLNIPKEGVRFSDRTTKY